MVKAKVEIKGTSFTDILEGFGRIPQEFPIMVQKAAEAQFEVVENQIRQNILTFTNSEDEGFLYDSVGQKVAIVNDSVVVGSVGIYHMDHVMSKHHPVQEGKAKHATAPQISYWLEYGTRNMSPRPYLLPAFLSTTEQQKDAFESEFNMLYERLFK